MKTFLGFTTGVLAGCVAGFIGGLFYEAYVLLDNKHVRQYVEENAFDK